MVKLHSFAVAVSESKWRHDILYDCDLLAFLFSSTYQCILQRPCKYRSPSCFSVQASHPWSRQGCWAMFWKDHSVLSRSDSRENMTQYICFRMPPLSCTPLESEDLFCNFSSQCKIPCFLCCFTYAWWLMGYKSHMINIFFKNEHTSIRNHLVFSSQKTYTYK